MAYLIDVGVLDMLEIGCHASLASVGGQITRWRERLHVSEAIWGEFSRKRHQSWLCDLAHADKHPVEVLPLPLTPEAIAGLQRLRPSTANAVKNLGEDEALVILTLYRPDLRWVSLDKRSVTRALHELGSARLLDAKEMFVELAEHGLLGRGTVEAIFRAIDKKHQPGPLAPRLSERLERLV